jgi:transposase, IS5 family
MLRLISPYAAVGQCPIGRVLVFSIHSRASRNHRLSDAQVEANRKKSKVRVRIEHVFGAQENAPGGRIIRTIGAVRARAKIGLQNLVYNLRRLVILERMATA